MMVFMNDQTAGSLLVGSDNPGRRAFPGAGPENGSKPLPNLQCEATGDKRLQSPRPWGGMAGFPASRVAV